MGGEYKRDEKEYLGKVELTTLGLLNWISVSNVHNFITSTGLDSKNKEELAKMLTPIKIGDKTYSGEQLLAALLKNKDDLKYLAFELVTDVTGNVRLYMNFELNRYAIKQQAAGGDATSQMLLTVCNMPRDEFYKNGKVLARAIIKNARLFAWNRTDKTQEKGPLKWEE